MPKKETFGSKLEKAQAQHANDNISVGDMTDSMGFDLMNKVREFVQNPDNQKHKKSFYILVAIKKDFTLATAIRVVLQARHTRPEPVPGYWLMRYDHDQSEIYQEWVLPNEFIIAKIEAMPQDYDPQLVQWVKLYRQGKL